MMVKYGVSLLDDIELIQFNHTDVRQKAIDHLKKNGIHEIRGVPVEDRLVLSSGWSAAVGKAKKRLAEDAAAA